MSTIFICYYLVSIVHYIPILISIVDVFSKTPAKNLSVKELLTQMVQHHRAPDRYCNLMTYDIDVAAGYPGCRSKIIKNYVCYGQCSTMYIPSNNVNSQVCSMCAPSKKKIQSVKLDCENFEQFITVPIVTECTCKMCELMHDNDLVATSLLSQHLKKQRRKQNIKKNSLQLLNVFKERLEIFGKNDLKNKHYLGKALSGTINEGMTKRLKKRKNIFTFNDLLNFSHILSIRHATK